MQKPGTAGRVVRSGVPGAVYQPRVGAAGAVLGPPSGLIASTQFDAPRVRSEAREGDAFEIVMHNAEGTILHSA